MIVVTLGIPGSASTWIFNVCRELLAADGEVATGFLHRETDFAAPMAARATHTLFKAHILSRRMIETLDAMGARILVTLRDPRDGVVSILERFRYSFDRALREVVRSAACIVMLGARADRIYRYEDRFWEPPGMIDTIAAALDLDLPDAVRRQVATAYRREALADIVAAIPSLDGTRLAARDGIVYDRLTHWHPNHFGDGAIGKWSSRLTSPSREIVESAFGWFGRGYDLAPTRWPPEVFHYRARTRRQDGRTFLALRIHDRAAIFGPELFLPPGRWRAVLDLEATAGTDVAADILIGNEPAAAQRASLPRGTKTALPLAFDHDDAALPIECRLFLQRPDPLTRARLFLRDPGAVQWLGFGGVALERLG